MNRLYILSVLLGSLFLMAFTPLEGLNKFVLPNGLTVYLKKYSRSPVVSVQLWVRTGAIDETRDNNGVSHFLEHMLFKGTENYSVSEISRIVESYGGMMNAGTSKEFTEYYIDISIQGYEQALKIIADIAQRASFPEEELNRERTVVLEEINRADDSPESTLYETFDRQLFTVTPYKWRILGTTTSVNGLTREKFTDYYRRHYTPENMVLVIAGDISIPRSKKLVERYYSYLAPGKKNIRVNLAEPVKPPSEIKIKKDVQLDYVMCGFLGPDLDSPFQYSGDVLSTVLGAGLSSRLYRKLREEKQLAYSISCGFSTQLGNSIFVISAACQTEKTGALLNGISSELDNAVNGKIEEDEIKRAKETILSSWYFSQETCGGIASTIGYWALLERLDYIRTYIRNINKVTEKDLKDFLKKYYKGLTTTVVYPGK